MKRLLTFFMLLALAGPVFSQNVDDPDLLSVDLYLDLESASNPQLSPNGTEIIYTRNFVDKIKDSWSSELWIMDADGSRNRFLTKGSSPKWSPQGDRIAYLTKGLPDGNQIHVKWMDDEGAVSQITRETETPQNIKWSPDGTMISFMMHVPDKETWNINMPAAPEGASWTKAPRMISRMHYQRDRIGFTEEGNTHLFTVPAEGGTPRQLTADDWLSGSGYSWMPDGNSIVFSGLIAENADEVYRESYIYAVDVMTQSVSKITTEKGQWGNPIVSPDGKHIAFTGFPFTTQSYHASELFVMEASGSNARKISGDLDRDAGQLFWSSDSKGVYFTAGNHGTRNVYLANLDGTYNEVTEGNHMLSLSSVEAKMNQRRAVEMAVATSSSFHNPSDVVLISLSSGEITQVTDLNSDILAGKKLGEVEEIWYTSTDETQVQGWIVKPPDFDANKEYPLILHIHGGPHAMYNVSFSYPYQNYAANGYVVLYTNPRGSTGYGTAFGNAIDNGYPSVDHFDLMAGVDAIIDQGYINEDELYITGCSGGGVLSSWAIGQTDRFAAAAVRCPVTNWMSFAGTADIVQWAYHRFDGYFWDDPTKWLEHSPLMHVGKVKTPVLLMTGELDLRTPMSQTEEYYAALKILGVPAVMLRFNDEYHGTSRKPSNFMRTQLYIMDWFNQYKKDSPETEM